MAIPSNLGVRVAVSIAVACLAFSLAGCAVVVPHEHARHSHASKKKKGPPPHAPAHGYRHKHGKHGTELVFDSGLGVYVVVDLEDIFFHSDHYYRWSDGRWWISGRYDAGWAVVSSERLPSGLRKHKHAKKKKHKHHVPASHKHGR